METIEIARTHSRFALAELSRRPTFGQLTETQKCAIKDVIDNIYAFVIDDDETSRKEARDNILKASKCF